MERDKGERNEGRNGEKEGKGEEATREGCDKGGTVMLFKESSDPVNRLFTSQVSR